MKWTAYRQCGQQYGRNNRLEKWSKSQGKRFLVSDSRSIIVQKLNGYQQE